MSKYTIIDIISNGSYGVVYQVKAKVGYTTSKHTIEEGDVFAMKKFTDITCYPPWDFIKEVDIINRLEHENIVDAIDVFKDSEGVPCIILPLAISDWRQYMKSNHWQLEQFHQMLSGLNHLHSNSVVHGDIKQDNILVFKHENKHVVKLADFGTSTIIDKNMFGNFFTLSYTPPELLDDRTQKHSFEADMWSIGVVFCEAVMGERRLFYGDNDAEILIAIKTFLDCDRWKTFSTSGPIHRLIARMLDKNPETRITVAETLEDPVFISFTYHPGRVIVPPEEQCIHSLPKIRKIIVRWMFDVSADFKITPQSTFASINLYDRYLNTSHGCTVDKKHLQLVACAAMSITLKLLEDFYPPVTDFVHMTADAFDERQITVMEYKLLKHVRWILYRPTILTILDHIPEEQLKKYYIQYPTSEEIIRVYDQDQISEAHDI